MKWFKHIADSLDDPDIHDAIERFGSDGYLVFFGTLEVMAKEFDAESPGSCRISVKHLRKKLQISRRKLTEILRFFEEKRRIFSVFDDTHIELSCPKLKGLSDTYTSKTFKQCSNNVRPIEVEEELEVEKEEIEEVEGRVSNPDHAKMIKDVLNCRPEFKNVKPEALLKAIHDAGENPRLMENHKEFIADMGNEIQPPNNPPKKYGRYLQNDGLRQKKKLGERNVSEL